MSNAQVSVVVTTRNEAVNIENCLRSIREQDYPDIEIIVVDNGSTDATKELSRAFTEAVYDKGPERSAQRNYGMIDKAGGEFVMFIDADMILAPRLISACVEHMRRSGCLALHIREIILGTKFWSRVRRFERSFYDGTVVDGARFFRKQAFEQVGGFDLSMSGPEDWDIDKKIKRIGTIDMLRDVPGAAGAAWGLARFVQERGIDADPAVPVIYHNESELELGRYLSKKGYYAKSMDAYVGKWGADDPDVRKQLGLGYRFFGVFFEQGKWKRCVAHPILFSGMYFLRFAVGVRYLCTKRSS